MSFDFAKVRGKPWDAPTDKGYVVRFYKAEEKSKQSGDDTITWYNVLGYVDEQERKLTLWKSEMEQLWEMGAFEKVAHNREGKTQDGRKFPITEYNATDESVEYEMVSNKSTSNKPDYAFGDYIENHKVGAVAGASPKSPAIPPAAASAASTASTPVTEAMIVEAWERAGRIAMEVIERQKSIKFQSGDSIYKAQFTLYQELKAFGLAFKAPQDAESFDEVPKALRDIAPNHGMGGEDEDDDSLPF